MESSSHDELKDKSDVDECEIITLQPYGQLRSKALKKKKSQLTDPSIVQDNGKIADSKAPGASPQKAEQTKTSQGKVEKDSQKRIKEKSPIEEQVSANATGQVESPVSRQLRSKHSEQLFSDSLSIRSITSVSKQSAGVLSSRGKLKPDDVAIYSSPKPVTTLVDVVMSSQAESWHTAVNDRSPAMSSLYCLGNGENSQSLDDDVVDVQGEQQNTAAKKNCVTPTKEAKMASSIDKAQTKKLTVNGKSFHSKFSKRMKQHCYL